MENLAKKNKQLKNDISKLDVTVTKVIILFINFNLEIINIYNENYVFSISYKIMHIKLST